MKYFIVEAKRSAIGNFLGTLSGCDIVDISSQIIKNGFNKNLIEQVEKVVIGNVYSSGLGQGVARKIAIESGCKENCSAYSVNMVCGSGMQAILNGIMEIEFGSDLVLCGGADIMSNVPFATKANIRTGNKFGDFAMTDLLLIDGLTDMFSNIHMGITAENIAEKYNITRNEQDEYAWLSAQRAKQATESSKFKEEIIPLKLKNKKGEEYIFETDETLNRFSTLEKLRILKPAFKKDGTVTAGNSSGLNDGVSFVMIASEEFCNKNDIKPLAEIVTGTATGCNPAYMGMGAYYAIEKLLNKSDIDFGDIDCFEINEAFAA